MLVYASEIRPDHLSRDMFAILHVRGEVYQVTPQWLHVIVAGDVNATELDDVLPDAEVIVQRIACDGRYSSLDEATSFIDEARSRYQDSYQQYIDHLDSFFVCRTQTRIRE